MAEDKEDNWLARWILKAVGTKKKKHKAFDDEDEGGGGGGLFKDINALRKPEVDPADAEAMERAKYTDGPIGQIATSKVFEFSTLGMICFNALSIGYDADYSARWGKPENLLDGPIGFIIIENMFCLYFTVEVLIRFLAYKKKTDCFCDAWFVFDSTLVTMMVLETWVLPFLGSGGPMSQLSIFRLLRLLRITRISRIMRAVPEMMVIVKGMIAATRTVLCTGLLLGLVLYTFCILFTDAYHESDKWQDEGLEEEPEIEVMFGTMGKSMFHLLIMGTILDDVTQATNAIRETGNTWMMVAFVIFILISSFMMLNMLIGILVEVVAATADGEREKGVETTVKEAIAQIFNRMDKDSNKVISRDEFLAMRDDEHVMEALSELDIMGSHFEVYGELFFKPEEHGGQMPSLTYDKLLDVIFRLRPGSFVSALDFAVFSKSITAIHDRVKDKVLKLEHFCEELAGSDDLTSLPRPDANATQLDPPQLGTALPHAPPPLPGPSGDPVSAFSGEGVAAPMSPPMSPGSLVQNSTESDKERLGRYATTNIIEELQRRLGMNELDKTAYSMMGEDLQNQLQGATEPGAEAFMTLGVPQEDDNDSGTVYV